MQARRVTSSQLTLWMAPRTWLGLWTLFVNRLLGNMALTNEQVSLNNIVDILGNDVEFLIVSAKLTKFGILFTKKTKDNNATL